MNTFTITAIDDDGTVSVKFSADNKIQKISGLSVADKDLLYSSLSDYGIAYAAGLETVTVKIDSAIEKNKTIKIDKSEVAPEVIEA